MKGLETAFRGQGVTGGRAGKMAKKQMEADVMGNRASDKKSKRRQGFRQECCPLQICLLKLTLCWALLCRWCFSATAFGYISLRCDRGW